MQRRGPLIDLRQARWIAKTAMTVELRRRGGGTGTKGRGVTLLVMLISYIMFGRFTGIVFPRGADLFTEGVIVCSVLMALVAVFVGTEFTMIVLSPEDHAFYLPLPVSARTFIATKLMVLCSFSAAYAHAFSAPLLNVAAFRGVPLASVGGLLYSLVLSSITITLLMCALLGIAVRVIPPRRIQSVAVYVQLGFLFVFYGGFGLAQGFLRNVLPKAKLDLTAALHFAPSAWGPCMFRLAAGGPAAVDGLGLSFVAPPLLFAASFVPIAPFYGQRFRDVVVPVARSRARAGARLRSLLWRTPEERAVALLIGNHFRFNPQFRLAILMVVPLTVVMVASTVFLNGVRIHDPFTAAGRADFTSTFLLYLMIAVFPFHVKTALTHSTEAEASWLIVASPADRTLLLRAVHRFTDLFFVLPYLLVLAGLFLFVTRALLHTVQHFAVLAVLVLIEMDVLLFMWPELPFSKKTTTAGLAACGATVRVRGRRIAAERLSDAELAVM